MSGIIIRLSNGIGSDRTLDLEIDWTVNPDAKPWSPPFWSGPKNRFLKWNEEGDPSFHYRKVYRYTSNIEDASLLFSQSKLSDAFNLAYSILAKKHDLHMMNYRGTNWTSEFARTLCIIRLDQY